MATKTSEPERSTPIIGDWIEYACATSSRRTVAAVRALGDGEVIVDGPDRRLEAVPLGAIREIRPLERKGRKS